MAPHMQTCQELDSHSDFCQAVGVVARRGRVVDFDGGELSQRTLLVGAGHGLVKRFIRELS